jgi:hypothetical protein
MDIVAATTDYEKWLRTCTPVYEPDLDYKHQQMRAEDPFPFFRGTYYRWVQRWAETAGELAAAPTVLGVGDLHVENFGTWRDADGRLCWGVNDFDEADRLPYTQDLARLAASVRFVKRASGLDIKLSTACQAILAGYRETLDKQGTPFVLEEHHPVLRALAMSEERDPVHFWKKLTSLLDERPAEPPPAAKDALHRYLPVEGLTAQIRFRPKTGMGSLGRPRYVALAEWAGGWVAREVKALCPPATTWVTGAAPGADSLLGEAVNKAKRSPDPFYCVVPGWVVRRLGPRCSRIEVTHLKQTADVERLLRALGSETANVHLGTPNIAPTIEADLTRRAKTWLEDAARTMADLLEKDWLHYKEAAPR